MEEEQNEKEDTRRMSAKAPPHKGCVNFRCFFKRSGVNMTADRPTVMSVIIAWTGAVVNFVNA